MKNFDYCDPKFDAAFWSELFENMGSHSQDWMPQSIDTTNSDLLNSNALHDTAFKPAPTSLMGTLKQTNYT